MEEVAGWFTSFIALDLAMSCPQYSKHLDTMVASKVMLKDSSDYMEAFCPATVGYMTFYEKKIF